MQVLRRYHIQDREDYKKYNKVAGLITKLTTLLQQLDSADEDRIEMTDQLLEKCAAHLRHSVICVCCLRWRVWATCAHMHAQ